jgi:oxygen-independent coproporphyrinogen-3 oxidase
MTGLRTSTGVSLKEIRDKLGNKFADYLEENSKNRILSNDLYWDRGHLHVTKKSKFLSDGIASDLFIIDL